MSGTNRAIAVELTGMPGGAESYWLRLRQVTVEQPGVDLDTAADFIDTIFDLTPCDPDNNSGGEAVELDDNGTPEPPVPESTYLKLAREVMAGSGLCLANEQAPEVEVDVIRSHPDIDYATRIIGAEIVETVRLEDDINLSVSLTGAVSHALEWPVIGDVRLEWADTPYSAGGPVAAIDITVSGSTLLFSRPVSGRLLVSFRTTWDRLTIRLDGSGPGDPDPARLLCFYAGMVAAHDIDQPSARDDETREIELLCDPGGEVTDTGDRVSCYELVTRETRCRCGDGVKSSSVVEMSVPCPEGISCPGGESTCRHLVGSRTVIAAYDRCPGEGDDNLADPDYYEDVCCTQPDRDLPRCRVMRGVYGGGHGVDPAAAGMYPGAAFVAVGPADGVCGTKTVTWQISGLDCCIEVEPLAVDIGRSVTVMAPSSEATVYFTGSRWGLEKTYEIFGIGFWFDKANTIKKIVSHGLDVRIYTDASACGTAIVTGTDGCATASTEIRATAGSWVLKCEATSVPITCECSRQHIGGWQISSGTFEAITGGERIIEHVECTSAGNSTNCGNPGDPDNVDCCDWYYGLVYDATWPPCIAEAGDWLESVAGSPCNPDVCAELGAKENSYRCNECDMYGGVWEPSPIYGWDWMFKRSVTRREVYEWEC